MKVRGDKVIHTTGTIVPEDVVRMSIDQQSIAHIMTILTDLYSDPPLAVIREYSTNALDSHRAAGIDDPIEVDLPSQMRRSYVVRDHGVGLSHDEIRDHYSKYGASSKRDTNDAVGILGLGCKSALTYTNQFSLTAVKNDLKISVLIGRDDDGVGVMKVLDTVPTDERNGVEITIPVSDPTSFNQKAEQFFSFWEQGTVLINGKEPESVFSHKDAMILDPDLVIVPTQNNRQYINGRYVNSGTALNSDYVVMGNIAYPCDRKLSEGCLTYGFVTVVRIDIGEIDFTPSREALHYTKHTNDTITACNRFVKENLKIHIQKEVEAADTRWKAAEIYHKWAHSVAMGGIKVTYKGEHIPDSIKMLGWSWQISSYDRKCSKSDTIHLSQLSNDKTVLVRNHPVRSMDARLKDALKDKFPQGTNVYAISDLINDKDEAWLEGTTQCDYADLHPKLPRQKRQPGQAPVETFKWSVWDDGKKDFTETDQKLVSPHITYVLRTDPNEDNNPVALTREQFRRSAALFVDRVNADSQLGKIQFAVVRTPEKEKFLKLHPTAVEFRKFLGDLLVDIERKLSDDALAWGVSPHELRLFDTKDVLDPETQQLIRRLHACMTPEMLVLHKQRKEVQATGHNLARMTFPARTFTSDIVEQEKAWRQRYPLLYNVRLISNKEHILEVMNALYLYRKEEVK